MVTSAYLRSCIVLMGDLTLSNIPHDWLITWNESLITRARNEMTATFLKTEWSHMFWIDSDIEFTSDDIIKVWNMGADIGMAPYCMKRPDKPLSAWRGGKLIRYDEFPNEPFEVDYAGTGFFCVARHVVEKLAETSEWYEGQNGKVPALYMTPIHEGTFESEDYNFCRKAREAGFKIMCEPTVRLGHWGQYGYRQD